MRRRMYETALRVWLALKEGIESVSCVMSYYVCKLFKALPLLLIIINPYVSVLVIIGMYEKRGCFVFGSEWLVPMIILLCAIVIQWIKDGLSETVEGCPVARRRFTRRQSNGAIHFNREDVYEMVEYLAEVEDYCEKNGKYRGTR